MARVAGVGVGHCRGDHGCRGLCSQCSRSWPDVVVAAAATAVEEEEEEEEEEDQEADEEEKQSVTQN